MTSHHTLTRVEALAVADSVGVAFVVGIERDPSAARDGSPVQQLADEERAADEEGDDARRGLLVRRPMPNHAAPEEECRQGHGEDNRCHGRLVVRRVVVSQARDEHGKARQAGGGQQQGAQAEGMAPLAEQGVEAGDGGDGGHGEGWHQGGEEDEGAEPSAQGQEEVDVGGVGGGGEEEGCEEDGG